MTGPFIKGVYMGSTAGIATVKMGWKLADGKPAVAYTSEDNVVPLSQFEPGTPVGLINSITKRECDSFILSVLLWNAAFKIIAHLSCLVCLICRIILMP